LLLKLESRHRNELLYIGLLFFIWAQLHSGFIFGFFLILIFAASEFILRKNKNIKVLLKALGIAALASLFNPNGIKTLLYPLSIISKKAAFANVGEYQPIFDMLNAQPLVIAAFVIFMALGCVSFFPYLSGKKNDGRSLAYFLIFLAFGYLAVKMMRNVSMFAVLCAPFISANLSNMPAVQNLRVKWKYLIIFSAVIIIIFVSFMLRWRIGFGVEKEFSPRAAFNFVKESGLKGNMFNTYSIGGYIIWQGYPEYKVFMDGRNDVYPETLLKEYDALVVKSKDIGATLSKYQVNYIIFKLTELNINTVAALLENGDWELVYSDEMFAVFAGNNSLNSGLINKYSYEAYLKFGSNSANTQYWQILRMAFEKAKKIDNKNPKAYLGLAGLYELLRAPVLAEKEYLSALSLDPKSAFAYTNLGGLYAAQGNYVKAKEAWEKADSIEPNSLAGKNLKLLEQMSRK
jgi:hypothetical protein